MLPAILLKCLYQMILCLHTRNDNIFLLHGLPFLEEVLVLAVNFSFFSTSKSSRMRYLEPNDINQ